MVMNTVVCDKLCTTRFIVYLTTFFSMLFFIFFRQSEGRAKLS